MKYFNEERFFSLVLIISTLIIYFKVVYFDFVNFDDPCYVLLNDNVITGLSWKNLQWAFSSFHSSNWHPLTWVSHMTDVYFFDYNAAGHHITNVIFHIVNSLLIFFFFSKSTGYAWRSFIIAGLFALHPIHVESVAWISERKDVLSAFFWLLTMICHLNYIKTKELKYYLLSLLMFILGLLSKPMVVTLPFALMLLEIWPLNRITFEQRSETLKQIKSSFLEKIPFFIFSSISCVITYLAQKDSGALMKIDALSFGYRVANTMISYLKYLGKIFWPENLAIQYPHPISNIDYALLIFSILIIFLMIFLSIKLIRTRPFLATGWFWFLGTLIPVIGLVQVGSQAMADRYTYIPALGIFFIVSFYGIEYKSKFTSWFVLVSSSVLVILSVSTWNQLDYWKNSKTLFSHSVECTGRNSVAHNLLGQALALEGDLNEGILHSKLSVELSPAFPEWHNNLGSLYAQNNMYKEAAVHFKEAVRLKPSYWYAHTNLGQLLAIEGNTKEAVHYLQKAEMYFEKNSYNHSLIGVAWAKAGDINKSIEHFRASLELRPNAPNVLNNLGKALLDKKDSENAKYYLKKALEISPNNPEIINNYGLVLLMENDPEGALIQFSYALKINPDYEKARINLFRTIISFSNQNKIKNKP